jgi:hypothetical protein
MSCSANQAEGLSGELCLDADPVRCDRLEGGAGVRLPNRGAEMSGMSRRERVIANSAHDLCISCKNTLFGVDGVS